MSIYIKKKNPWMSNVKIYGFYKDDELEYVGTLKEYASIYNVKVNSLFVRKSRKNNDAEHRYELVYIGRLSDFIDKGDK